MTHFLKNISTTHIWLITYAIYILYDLKFYFWFSDAKIFEIRQRKILQPFFSLECVGEIKFWLKIRIQLKISRRMICVDMGSKFISYHFSRNIAFHAYAIIIFIRIVGKVTLDPISMQTTRNFTLNSNWKLKFDSARAFERKSGFKIFAWANLQNFFITESEIEFQVIWCVYSICYESNMSHRAVFQKMSHSWLL